MFKRRKERNKILVVLDWDNIKLNLMALRRGPEGFSLAAGFDALVRELVKIGEIANVFVFIQPNTLSSDLEIFSKLGFFPILCPRVKDKEGNDIDTVDSTLIEFTKKMISQVPDLGYLCLGSGDKDFIPLLREVIKHRLKIMIVAGDINSLAGDLIDLVDKSEAGKKMIYFFSPYSDK